MGNMYIVAGCKFFIGGRKDLKSTDFVEADFANETWIEIDGWETAGEFDSEYTPVALQMINPNREITLKGIIKGGTMKNTFIEMLSDPGQTALKNAKNHPNASYAFKMEYNDKPDGGVNPTTNLFIGAVMTATTMHGKSNDPIKLDCSISVNSNKVVKAAA